MNNSFFVLSVCSREEQIKNKKEQDNKSRDGVEYKL